MAQTLVPVPGAVQIVECGAKWRYPLSLPRAPSCFFSLNLLFFAPSTLSECLEQIIIPKSVTSSLVFSVRRILEYPGAIILVSRTRRNV